MEKRFRVGDIAYVAQYRDHHLSFYIDSLHSNWMKLPAPCPSVPRFGDLPPERIYGQTPSNNIWAVKRELMHFVDAVLAAHRPYFFRFTANEPKKLVVYLRIAQRLANRYGYFVVRDGKEFLFYKRQDLCA